MYACINQQQITQSTSRKFEQRANVAHFRRRCNRGNVALVIGHSRRTESAWKPLCSIINEKKT